ncbi:MAG: DUF4136 domain-containing protein [Gammaproteobacteria bacterium]|nr:DUF4136 domain-containing protein [Gammaproteobacteria bacterium]
MKNIYATLVALLFLFITACASPLTQDIEVDAEADPKANLAGYKTYAWLGSAAILYDPRGKWEPPAFDADAEIKFLIDRELRNRGIKEVAVNPDLIVGFAAGIDMEALELVENKETKLQVLENVPKGSLVIVLIDGSTGNPVWASAALGNVQQEISSDDVRKRLDYAVTQMFKLMKR